MASALRTGKLPNRLFPLLKTPRTWFCRVAEEKKDTLDIDMDTDDLRNNSNDCARGAGYVLDACTRPNSAWVQGSEYAHGNGNELIRVRHP